MKLLSNLKAPIRLQKAYVSMAWASDCHILVHLAPCYHCPNSYKSLNTLSNWCFVACPPANQTRLEKLMLHVLQVSQAIPFAEVWWCPPSDLQVKGRLSGSPERCQVWLPGAFGGLTLVIQAKAWRKGDRLSAKQIITTRPDRDSNGYIVQVSVLAYSVLDCGTSGDHVCDVHMVVCDITQTVGQL